MALGNPAEKGYWLRRQLGVLDRVEAISSRIASDPVTPTAPGGGTGDPGGENPTTKVIDQDPTKRRVVLFYGASTTGPHVVQLPFSTQVRRSLTKPHVIELPLLTSAT